VGTRSDPVAFVQDLIVNGLYLAGNRLAATTVQKLRKYNKV
jgi:hypothetical protein